MILGVRWTREFAIYDLFKKKNQINSEGRKYQRRILKESWYRKFAMTVPVEEFLKLAVAVTGLLLTFKVQLTELILMFTLRVSSYNDLIHDHVRIFRRGRRQ